MAQIYDLIKGQRVHSVTPDHTAVEAARLMTEHSIGAVPVMQDGDLVGILSERDIMTRVVAAGRSPGITRVSEVMTAKPRVVAANESVENCVFMMREFGFRHLPVFEGNKLMGVVSVRDIALHTGTR